MTARGAAPADPIGPDAQASAVDRRRRAWIRPLLWTLQGWLPMFYVAAGYAKLTQPMELLIRVLTWPDGLAWGAVSGIGALEIVLALGVLSSLISRRLRLVVSVSAGLLFVLAAVMATVHLGLGEADMAALNLVLMGLAAGVARGR